MEKINAFREISGLKDEQETRSILEEFDWDVDKAYSSQYSSVENVNNNNNNVNDNNMNNNNNNGLNLKLTLPDHRQFSYRMPIDGTFWEVYGFLVQSVPELTQKQFTFKLPNGHQMNESEFDQTLQQNKLHMNDELKIIY